MSGSTRQPNPALQIALSAIDLLTEDERPVVEAYLKSKPARQAAPAKAVPSNVLAAKLKQDLGVYGDALSDIKLHSEMTGSPLRSRNPLPQGFRDCLNKFEDWKLALQHLEDRFQGYIHEDDLKYVSKPTAQLTHSAAKESTAMSSSQQSSSSAKASDQVARDCAAEAADVEKEEEKKEGLGSVDFVMLEAVLAQLENSRKPPPTN